MSKVSAGCVSRTLTKDQKKSRFDISKYLASLCDDDPEEFMRRVVAQDEPWVHNFDPEAGKLYAIDHFHLYEDSSAGKVIVSVVFG